MPQAENEANGDPRRVGTVLASVQNSGDKGSRGSYIDSPCVRETQAVSGTLLAKDLTCPSKTTFAHFRSRWTGPVARCADVVLGPRRARVAQLSTLVGMAYLHGNVVTTLDGPCRQTTRRRFELSAGLCNAFAKRDKSI